MFSMSPDIGPYRAFSPTQFSSGLCCALTLRQAHRAQVLLAERSHRVQQFPMVPCIVYGVPGAGTLDTGYRYSLQTARAGWNWSPARNMEKGLMSTCTSNICSWSAPSPPACSSPGGMGAPSASSASGITSLSRQHWTRYSHVLDWMLMKTSPMPYQQSMLTPTAVGGGGAGGERGGGRPACGSHRRTNSIRGVDCGAFKVASDLMNIMFSE